MTATPTDKLLDAILPHVAFDGWSDAAFRDACDDTDTPKEDAAVLCPRGAIDLAVAFHRRGDAVMVAEMQAADVSEMRYSEKVAHALKLRLQAIAPHREAVRRASTLFAMPQHAAEGAGLVWETADHVWNALGDTSQDGNWYSKRAILSAVWGSTVLFWLGDDSDGAEATHAFIDRRIDNVMQFEKAKSSMRENPLTRPIMSLQDALFSKMRAPGQNTDPDLPGRWTPPTS